MKTCPEQKIINPATGRCVSATGAIGKRVSKGKAPVTTPPRRPSPDPSPKRKNSKTCPEQKIVNPATGRCVSATGSIGKRVSKGKAPYHPVPRPTPAPPTPGPPVPVVNPQRCFQQNKILNPATGKCVSMTGAIGKRLVRAGVHHRANTRPNIRSTIFTPLRIGQTNVRVPKNIDQCGNVLTYRQEGGICWFTSIMAVMFMSQHMRMRVTKAVKSMSSPLSIEKALIVGDIAQILAGYDKRQVSSDLFGRLQPHEFLKTIRSAAPNVFDNSDNSVYKSLYPNKITATGRNGEFYLHKMMDYLEIPHLSVSRDSANEYDMTYAMLNLDLSQYKNVEQRDTVQERTYVTVNNPDVIMVLTDNHVDRWMQYYFKVRKHKNRKYASVSLPALKPFEGVQSNAHAPRITYGGVSYVLDGVTISNSNSTFCNKNHAIAGVTCNGQRFIYNGWAARSRDPTMPAMASVSKFPCALMPVDWSRRKSLKIDLKGCKMVPASVMDSVDMAFDTVNRTIAIYVREESSESQFLSPRRTFFQSI